jgi:sialidase-1
VLDDPGERHSACNPATVLDRLKGRVWVFNVRTKPGRSSFTSRRGTDDATTWTRYSDDNGQTWSEPIDITQASRDVKNWGGSFFGPGGPIQNRKGRLIVPLSRTTGRRNPAGKLVGGPWNAFVIYSDDHGQSWQRGGLLPEGEWASESQVVELADGRILMEARQTSGPNRLQATSSNGGQTWSKPQPGQAVTRVACAIERYTLKSAGDDRNRIVWSGPKGPGRKNLVVRTSYDEGQTFTNERLISPDHAAYSDLTILKDGTVGVLWERGVKGGYEFITFSRLKREFLEPAN